MAGLAQFLLCLYQNGDSTVKENRPATLVGSSHKWVTDNRMVAALPQPCAPGLLPNPAILSPGRAQFNTQTLDRGRGVQWSGSRPCSSIFFSLLQLEALFFKPSSAFFNSTGPASFIVSARITENPTSSIGPLERGRGGRGCAAA